MLESHIYLKSRQQKQKETDRIISNSKAFEMQRK